MISTSDWLRNKSITFVIMQTKTIAEYKYNIPFRSSTRRLRAAAPPHVPRIAVLIASMLMQAFAASAADYMSPGVITYSEASKQRIYAFVRDGNGDLGVNYWDGFAWHCVLPPKKRTRNSRFLSCVIEGIG